MVQDGSPPTRRASAKEAPADTVTQRHVLPRDLPNAVKYLTDTEPSAQPNPTNEPAAKQSSSRHKGQTEVANVSLTRGQVNAVRAATKAGIKPSQIARQFGISQSDVRKVLASDTATRRAT
jgi:microcompartment protein CcmL/EutN